MNKLQESVIGLVVDETHSAKEQYGERYSSNAEAYAVLLEEVEEAEEELDRVKELLKTFWRLVRGTECSIGIGSPTIMSTLDRIERHARLLACESIQVAAVASKAVEPTYEDFKSAKEAVGP